MKVIPIWIIVMIVSVMFMSTVIGMQIYAPGQTRGQIQSSEFMITSEQTSFHGPNKIVVKLTLSNTDSTNPHSADVTVFLLNSSGNKLMNVTYQTGVVAASGTVSNMTVFDESNIVLSYTSTFIQVMDTN